ncbi:MAG TPA: NB-ARC domain-containing protein [Bryobacteraceae bacterium]|nr:NB-ARC domain-containing protein [Bryobacteraceae bacterium]
MASLFLSYAHADGQKLARRLADDLSACGHAVWLDNDRFLPGSSWSRRIEDHIDAADAVVALVSRASYRSDICRCEHSRALRLKKRLIPILVHPDANHPLYLEAAQYIPFHDRRGYQESFRVLLDAIAADRSATGTYRSPHVTAPPLPLNFVPRPAESESLRKSLINDASGRRIALTAVGGMGGIGKTTLAQALCHDWAIQDAFPDGVLWAAIGQNPTDLHLATQMRAIAKALGGDPAHYDTLQACGNQFRTTLRDRSALIVLDDVWDARDVQPFLSDASRSRLLLTTRQRDVVKAASAQEFSLDVLEPDQARALLARWSQTAEENLPPVASEIIEECGRLPLAIAMAGAFVAAETGDAWRRALERLKNADLRKVPYPTLYRAIQVSVAALEPEEYRSRYLDFAVFRPGAPVPPKALETFWNTDADSVACVVSAWVGASLANRAEAGITLHGLQMDFVKRQAADPAELHRILVERYRARCPDGWASGPDDGYFFTWLTYHLSRVGRTDELRELLLDPAWMRARLARKEIPALLADYDYLADDPAFQLVKDALRLSAHTLANDPSLLASQLTGRLGATASPEVHKLLEIARQSQRAPWLEAVYQTLKAPGGPLLQTLKGHAGRVRAVAVTPDGRRAVSGSFDHTLKLWDLERGEAIRTLEGHADSVNAVAMTLDGKRAVSGSNDQTLKLWDLESGKAIRTLEGHAGGVNAVAMTPDGRRAVSGSSDHTLKLWDLERGKAVRTLEGHAGWVWAVAVTLDGKRAVSGSSDHTLKLWDLERGKAIRTLEGHAGWVWAVSVTPDGKWAVAGLSDKILILWDLERGAALSLEGHAGGILAVAVTPDGMRAVSGSSDHTLKLWDLERGKTIRTLEGHAGGVLAVTVTPDGKRAVSGSSDHTLKLWDLERGAAIPTLEGHADSVRAVSVTPDGKRAVTGSSDHTLKLWDLERGAAIRTLEASWVNAVAVTPDGKRAVSASSDLGLKLWDLERGEAVRTLEGHSHGVNAVTVTPDGRRAVSGSSDNTLKLWDLARGEAIRTLEGHAGEVNAVAVTPDGKRAVSGSDDKTLKLWDLRRGVAIRTLEGHSGWVRAVAVTPDGKRAVSGSSDHTVKLWDLERGEAIRTLEGHSDGVNAVTLTPDGKRAVSGSADNTVKLWDLGTGEAIASFGGEGAILCCAALPDGLTFLAGEASGTLHFLKLREPGKPRRVSGPRP